MERKGLKQFMHNLISGLCQRQCFGDSEEQFHAASHGAVAWSRCRRSSMQLRMQEKLHVRMEPRPPMEEKVHATAPTLRGTNHQTTTGQRKPRKSSREEGFLSFGLQGLVVCHDLLDLRKALCEFLARQSVLFILVQIGFGIARHSSMSKHPV